LNLIVGGTGFIGGHLAEYFFKEGEISKGIFRKGSHLRIMDQCGIQCIEADVMDRHTLHEPLDMVDVVYNLASPPPGGGADEYSSFNNVALNNLLEEANEHGAKFFVHLSCLDVYGSGGPIDGGTDPKPRDGYQKAKLDAETIVTEFGRKNPDMKVRVVRASRVVGPRDITLTVPLLKMIEQGKVILPAVGQDSLSFSHPKDVAQSLLKAATYAGDWDVCLIKSFDSSVEDLSKALSTSTGKKTEIKTAGMFSGRTQIPQYTIEQLKAKRTIRDQEFWKKIAYTPLYTLEKTAQEVAEWQRKEPWATKDST
jgi:nucleoside-diphosphate-sugar epimerase